MKYGVSFFSFDEGVDFKEAMQQCKDAGYQGVEFVLSNGGEITMSTPEKKIEELKKAADDIGIQVCSVGAWNSWDNNLGSGDEAERERAKDLVKKQIDVAQITGADVALVVPGYTGTPLQATKTEDYDVVYTQSQKSLTELSDYAKGTGVTIAIEEVWNKFLLSPLEFARYLDEINRDNVMAYFDIGNIIYIGYPEQWIKILGHRIKRLQFDDCRVDGAGLSMFVDIFEGDVNYEKVMKAVHDIGYDDWAVIEFYPGYKSHAWRSIKNAKLSLDEVMSIKV